MTILVYENCDKLAANYVYARILESLALSNILGLWNFFTAKGDLIYS